MYKPNMRFEKNSLKSTNTHECYNSNSVKWNSYLSIYSIHNETISNNFSKVFGLLGVFSSPSSCIKFRNERKE